MGGGMEERERLVLCGGIVGKQFQKIKKGKEKE